MKFGISSVVFEDYGLSLREVITVAASCGYDAVELNFKEWPGDLDVDEIKAALKVQGIRVSAIGTRHMLRAHGLWLASPDEGNRARSIEYVRRCFELLDELDSGIVQMGWAFQGSGLSGMTRQQAARNAVDSLKEIARFAGSKRVVLEPINRYDAPIVHTLDEAARLAGEVGSESILVMADTFHMNIEEASIEKSIIGAGGKLGYVQLSDSNRLAPGRGHIDFSEVLAALSYIDYEGYLVMEYNSDGGGYEEQARSALQHMLAILANLR